MICGTLDHLERYEGLSDDLKKGLKFLTETDWNTIEDGRYSIEGETITAKVSTYQPKPENNMPEAHREYIDIQYLAKGEVCIGYAPLSDAQEMVRPDPEHDVWFYKADTVRLELKENHFVIFWPDDLHAPGIATPRSTTCKNCVIKIRIRK